MASATHTTRRRRQRRPATPADARSGGASALSGRDGKLGHGYAVETSATIPYLSLSSLKLGMRVPVKDLGAAIAYNFV